MQTAPIQVLVKTGHCRNTEGFFLPRDERAAYKWGVVPLGKGELFAADFGFGDKRNEAYRVALVFPDRRYRSQTLDAKSGAVLDSEEVSAYEVVGRLLKTELGDCPSVALKSPNEVYLGFAKSGYTFAAYVEKLRAGMIEPNGKPVLAAALVRSNGCSGI